MRTLYVHGSVSAGLPEGRIYRLHAIVLCDLYMEFLQAAHPGA